MLRILVFLTLLGLTLSACGDEATPVTELSMSLEVIEPQGSDPLLIRTHIRNVGNTRTVSVGACWLVSFTVTDAYGNIVQTLDPCMLMLLDCRQIMVELQPRQRHREDLQIHGVVYEMHQDAGHVWCDEFPMNPGEYTARATVAYRGDHMGERDPSLTTSATTTFVWN